MEMECGTGTSLNRTEFLFLGLGDSLVHELKLDLVFDAAEHEHCPNCFHSKIKVRNGVTFHNAMVFTMINLKAITRDVQDVKTL
jgi:hypothetical protein